MSSIEKTSIDHWRFSAFISYSHKDKIYAKRLHRRLEAYRLPVRLRSNSRGFSKNGALGKFFRDKDDFAASGDLSESIRSAIAASQALIIVCSPNSKRSRWVANEISLFRKLHPNRPILTTIIDGEPQDAIPDLILENREPLAADLRTSADGPRLGFLKIVAAIADVPLDALINRDAQRRLATVTTITVFASIIALVMALMTTVAINSRNLARVAQQQAEAQARSTQALNDYLVGDYRDVLIQRVPLDVATEFYPKVLEYCRQQADSILLNSTGRENCVGYMWSMGTDKMSEKSFEEAVSYFDAAVDITGRALSENPRDPNRILDHIKSLNRIGFYEYETAKYSKSIDTFASAIKFLDLVDDESKLSAEWVAHSSYLHAAITKSILATDQSSHIAMPHIIQSLKDTISLINETERDLSVYSDLGFHIQWLAMTLLTDKRYESAVRASDIALSIVDFLTEREPGNLFFIQQKIDVYDRHVLILQTAEPTANTLEYRNVVSDLSAYLQSLGPEDTDCKTTEK